jgi:hypothetical protein
MGLPFLTSIPDGGEWSAARPSRFTPGEITPPRTHWIRDWVSPSAGLDAVEKIKNFPCQKSNPGLPARSPSLYRLIYSDSEAVVVCLKNYFNICLEILKKISSNSDIKAEASRSRLEPDTSRIRNSCWSANHDARALIRLNVSLTPLLQLLQQNFLKWSIPMLTSEY